MRLASKRRLDVPERVGGPASWGNAERPGPHQDLRPLEAPVPAAASLFHKDMNPRTRETDRGAGGEAGPRRVAQVRAAEGGGGGIGGSAI